MNGHRRARVREIFHGALESEDREAYLAEATGSDDELERAVKQLLAAHDATGVLPKLDASDPPTPPREGGTDLGPDGLQDTEHLLRTGLASRYQVERPIGAGGMAEVYLARDLRHGRDVAIKAMSPRLFGRHGVDRFLQEIQLTAQLHHPHILPLFDSGEIDGTPYYVMPFIEGVSLAQRIREVGQLPLGEALGIAGQVASALDFAHASGVVHRDIKPGNILLRDHTAFVCDFGIGFARASETRITGPGSTLGSPAYMSPEQATGDGSVDQLADVYAIACMTYEMLGGDPPFTGGSSRAVMLRHVHDPVPPLSTARPALGAGVDAVFHRALAKAPADRFPTASAFVEALAQTVVVDPRRIELGVPRPTGRLRPPSSTFAMEDAAAPTLDQRIRICTGRDGVKIAWAECGAGPPLVKAANWLSHLEHDAKSPLWRHWWQGLSRHHTLIRYDERGQGLSDREVADISFEAWVADLEAVVEAAALDRFTLLGVSKGGPIATAYAHRHPERVERLVLLGAYPLGRAKAGDAEWESKARVEVQLVRLGWGEENPAHRQVFSSLFFPDADPQRIAWFNELQRVSASPENAARIMEAAFAIDVTREARELTVPTLIFHSQDEERVPVAAGRYFASLIPGAVFMPLPSRNHIPLEHEPAWHQFLAAFDQFTRPP